MKPLTILLLIFGFAATTAAQSEDDWLSTQQDYRVTRFTTADGFPTIRVYGMLEDRQGFLWLGTEVGLVRYDGYTFETFGTDGDEATQPGTVSSTLLFEDSNGDLWISTWLDGILNRDRSTGRFTQYNLQSDDDGNSYASFFYESPAEPGILWIGPGSYWVSIPEGLGGVHRMDTITGQTEFISFPYSTGIQYTFDVHEDSTGLLWFGSWGLYSYDRDTRAFTHVLPDPAYPIFDLNEPRGWSNVVYSIHEDQDGIFWLGTGRGLYRYDREADALTPFFPNPVDSSPIANTVYNIYADQSGLMWIMLNVQLYTFDPTTGRFSFMCECNTRLMLEDRTGALWLSNTGTGLLKLDPLHQPFKQYRFDQENPNGQDIRTIYQDRKGYFWIGGSRGYFGRFDQSRESLTHYKLELDLDNRSGLIGDGGVYGIYEDRSGVFWISSFLNGLVRFEPESDAFTYYRHDPDDLTTLSSTRINHVLEDHLGNFWVPTIYGGLNLMDREAQIFKHFRHDPDDPNSLGSDFAIKAFEDRSGTLWITTDTGTSRFNREDSTFTNYHAYGLRWSLNLLEDSKGRFWVATAGHGLQLFDRETGSLTSYTTRNGLAHNVVRSILEDDQGNLWLGTENGLSRFNPDTETFRTFDTQDGLLGDAFSEHATYKGNDGELFFGGEWGMISFFPDQIRDESVPPNVVITSFTASGEVVPTNIAVSLAHTENDLVIDYVGLHFTNPTENRYRYRLEPYEDHWVEAGTQRTARYPNLPPGHYTFRTTASNSDRVWSEEGASLSITIRPPWWRTIWAYMIYGLLFAAGVFAIDRFQRRRLIRREREQARERELEQAREIEKAYHELRQAKDRLVQQEKLASLGELTAGIAHEIKNPLNFVNNFSEINEELAQELREAYEADPNIKLADLLDLIADLEQNAAIINQHGKRADGIVSAMMQHASDGTGQREPTDVNALLEEYVNLAYHGKRAKIEGFNCEIERDYDQAVGVVEMVPQEIGRVFLNLLSNAFDAVYEKAQSVGGNYEPTVRVQTQRQDDAIIIRIQDNGPGIPMNLRQKIYEPFFTTKPTGSGTGLGLSLSHDIVTKGHGGTLMVESIEGEGATFIVTLPGIPG